MTVHLGGCSLQQSAGEPAAAPSARRGAVARLRLLVLPQARHAYRERPAGHRRYPRRQFYRFGTGTAEFVICRNCGVYIGAIGDSGSGMRAVINTICLDDRALFTREPAPTDHDGETIEDRLASRAAALIHRWTSERAAVRWWWRYPGSTASSVA
jgi:hypothetical protein